MSTLPMPDFVSESGSPAEPVSLGSLESRRHQMFPVLTCAEMARLERFGNRRVWNDGEAVFEAGRTSPGMVIVVDGDMRISRANGLGGRAEITMHGPGHFAAEVGQLSGRPSLVYAHAVGRLDALVVPSACLRALVVAEAELGERIMRALILRRVGLLEVGSSLPALIGPPGNTDLFRLQSFLASNGHPQTVLDPATSPEARALVELYAPQPHELPLVVCPDGVVKKNPSLAEMGECLGLLPPLNTDHVYDVLVVGAGPSGLATAVYAASEGLCVMVVEQRSFGGQAGASARIENYLGFPTGVSGRALSGRAFVQAQKFGAEVAIPAIASRLMCDQFPLKLALSNGTELKAKAVVLACGARYRKPPLPGIEQYEGNGVYYWAGQIEGKLCMNEEVVLVGGGNSAGQAAVFLSGHARKVHILIRGPDLTASMSSYLIERIEATANIELHPHTQLTALIGDQGELQSVRWQTKGSDEVAMPIRRVFLFVGADPNTDWLADCGVRVDEHGFIMTGTEVMMARCRITGHMLNPDGSLHGHLETTVPGVFAIGDVRAGSTKRVAAAVGEGAAAVAQIHSYLATLQGP